jgi:hypothetical protein
VKTWTNRRPTLPQRLLHRLAAAPMERDDFYETARRMYADAGRKQGPVQRINQMLDEGFIVLEVRLTEKGRQKLGDQKERAQTA